MEILRPNSISVWVGINDLAEKYIEAEFRAGIAKEFQIGSAVENTISSGHQKRDLR